MYRRELPREPLLTPPFLRLCAFNFVTFLTAFQLFPTIPFRIIALGGTKAQAGLFLAIYTYACAFAAPITGTLADHIGRRRLLMFAASAFVVFSCLYGLITWLPLLLLAACIHGIFWSAILASSAAITTELIPDSRRTEGMAWWGMASTAAVAVAPLIGLTLYRIGWEALCVEMALLSLLMIFMATRVQGGSTDPHRSFPHLRDIIDWRVMTTALTLFVVSFSYGGITSYVALLSMERHVEPRSLFFTVFAVTILISRIFTAPIGDRFSPRMLLFPSLLLVPVALLAIAVADSRGEIVLAAILFGVGFGGAYPAFVTFVLGRTDPQRRGATFGSILWAFDTGIGTGSLVTGVLAQQAGFTVAFRVAAVLSAIAIPLFLLTSRLLGSEAHASGST